jgi:hypothetical protein
MKDEGTGNAIGMIDIHGSDDGFEGIGQDAGPRPAARELFTPSHEHIVAYMIGAKYGGQRHFTDYTGPGFGKFSFGHMRIMHEQIFANDQIQDSVAEKFQTFVKVDVAALIFIGIGRMSQCGIEELQVAEGRQPQNGNAFLKLCFSFRFHYQCISYSAYFLNRSVAL